MRASVPPADLSLILAQIELAYGTDQVRGLSPAYAEASPETLDAILTEASRFAQGTLVPLNDAMDAVGCRLEQGRVRTAPGHCEAWTDYVAAGWPTLDQPAEYGGQDLPPFVTAAVQELFDRACPAFGMQPVPQRAAAKLIAAWGDEATRAQWLPLLATGEIGATICISEAGAGSDAGRMRALARPDAGGGWSITGEKSWISFADHDLTGRILHCILARTPDAEPGGRGVSLFLAEGGTAQVDAIAVQRIEHKMGLHGSPTCVLGLEGARAHLLGSEGRGLSQMFVMITQMRIAVGVMGLGIASGACDVAMAYAAERIQGGPVDVPVAIIEHADVQRQLMEMVARVETLRGLVLAVANLGELAPGDEEAQALLQWLLPIIKTVGSDAAFDVASIALQVLGGAGYTREWPVEQALRDARVLSVFEGTTGIQGLDLVHRRVLRGDEGLRAFLAVARAEAGGPALDAVLDLLEDGAGRIRAMAPGSGDADAGATAFLHLAGLAATGWIAARLARAAGDAPAARRLQAAGAYWLDRLEPRARAFHAEAVAGHGPLTGFANVRPRP